MKTRKYLPYRARNLAHYPDGKWLPGTRWSRFSLLDPMGRLALKSNARMRLRKIWPYSNAAPASTRWSGHFAKWRDHA